MGQMNATAGGVTGGRGGTRWRATGLCWSTAGMQLCARRSGEAAVSDALGLRDRSDAWG